MGVRFKGVEKTNVDEYCVSEGWVRLTAGGAKDRKGNSMTIKLQGPVEPYFRDVEAAGGGVGASRMRAYRKKAQAIPACAA